MFAPAESSLPLNLPLQSASAIHNEGTSQHHRSFSGSSTVPDNSNPNGLAQPTQKQLNSRSCVTCRRRKVRCNKRNPCSNCTKAGIECIFPAPGRAPRRPKRPQDAELLSRLRRLESVIEQIREKKGNDASPPRQPQGTDTSVANGNYEQPKQQDATATENETRETNRGEEICPYMFEPPDPRVVKPHNIGNEFGRLVIDEGRSRYVNNRFWASLGDEIEEMQDILDPSSSDEDDYPSPSSSANSTGHDGFLMGFYSLSHSLRGYHPSPEQISVLWNVYLENIAPLISILHKPTLKKLFDGPAQNPNLLDKNSEALLFTIYFVSIISMPSEHCQYFLGDTRDVLVSRYRFAVEQALAKANLLNTQNLLLLQAAVIFLIGVRREDDTKFVWAMAAVVLRLAQGLGLHRDGTNFGLKPFETEMRRRLWWQICLLDTRASEDHGTDPQINELMYDTRLPLNIDDEDISPDMQESPTEREGATEMTFSLIRFEITAALRRASYRCPSGRFRFGSAQPPIKACGNIIHIVNRRIEERYIKHCDMNVPIYWVSATVARLILAKLWLIVHHPMTQQDRNANISQGLRENLFLTSIEVVEFARLLETHEHTSKWGWLFRTNMQWYCVAFVLSELCVRRPCSVTDRAWHVVNSVYNVWEEQAKHKKGMLWRPLSRLMKRAAAIREKQQQEMRAQFGSSSTVSEHPLSLPAHAGQTSVDPRLPQFLPQMKLDLDVPAPVAAPVPPEEISSGQLDMSFGEIDLTRGTMGVISDLFPHTDWLAMDPTSEPPSAGADMLGIPNTSTTSVERQQDMSTPQLNWEEWDRVMRDFQMDLQRTETDQPSGNVSDWLA